MKKSFLMFISFLLVFGLLLAGCNSSKGSSGGGDSKSKNKNIAVIVKSNQFEYWQTVKMGAEKAGKKYGYHINFKGPQAETDISKEVSMVEDAVNKGVAGIVLAASDPNSLIPPIKKADQAGIPVITIDSGVKDKTPKSFVATDNEKAAAIAADKLANLIGKKGKVAIVNFVAGASTAIDREKGFKKEMKKYPGIKIVHTFYSDGEPEKALQQTQDLLTSTPDIKGIFGANEGSAVGVARGLKESGKAGKVKLIGFDNSDDEINYIKKGVMQGIVVQDPYKIGYQGVEQAVKVIKGKDVKDRIDTGATYVNKENLNNEDIQKLLHPEKRK